MRTFALLVLALGLDFDADDNRPVSKVINLLKDMQTQLEGEKAHDEEVYDKLSCWCKVNGKGKDTAVDAATRKIAELDATVKALTAKASQLDAGIKTQTDENAANQESLNTAAEMRAKERAEFQADDKELLLNIDSLKNAMVILSRTHTSFLQGSAVHVEAFLEAQRAVKSVLKGPMDDALNQILNPTDKQLIQQFVQAGINPGNPQYSSHAGEIVGVLKQMKEEFSKNLSDASAAENKAQEEFDQLKAAKSEEIASGVSLVKSKERTLAKTNEALAEAKEDRSDTNGALTADQAFLMDLRERCANADKEWAGRSKTRQLEISAVSEAIAILASDDSHDQFAKTLSFVQVNDHAKGRRAAQRILMQSAAKSKSSTLMAVAAAVQLDAFGKVTDMIDKMLVDLAKEQADEVKHKDFCNDELHTNDKEQFAKQNEVEDLTANIDTLASQIDTFEGEIKALDASVAEMTVQLQRANENRVAEDREFQTVVADQRATQVILRKALDKLEKFYGDARAFVQAKAKGAEPGPAPPPGFSEYKSNSGAGGVTTMIQSIITDAKGMEDAAIGAEVDSEAAYQQFTSNTFAAIAAAQKQKVDKAEAKAKATKDKVQKAADKDAANDQAKGLSDVAAQLHSSCDFVLQNFDVRQEARDQEMDGLKGAIAALKSA